ncbi:CATRA conflict system CASPASE/TPR repeat-associated protein [Streptomyces sp. NPDC002574]|uniref:CATRA conflict system CASPASE/TPR repeat-associated protein n=1 Tax=Streptomyces sp. NPDC002574 TaxID=3364652 RepID=UPI0036B12870
MHRFVKPSLIITCFVPAVPEPGDTSAREYLARLWDACGMLGMTAAFGGLPLSARPFSGSAVPAAEFTVLAAATREDGPGIHAAYAFAEHDVLGLVALLAPNDLDAGLEQWTTLLDQWSAALTAAGVTGLPPATILGEYRVFTALYRGGTPRSQRSMAESVRHHVPSPGGGDETWWRGHDVTEHGFSVWRTGGEGLGDPGAVVSDFCVLAPLRAEAALDEWAWAADGESGLRPLTHYLTHAAKAGYEARRYHAFASKEPLHARRAHSDRESVALLRALQPTAAGEPVSLQDVLAAAAMLDRTQLGPHGMLWTITQHRDLSRTVSIAISNMGLYAPRLRRVGAGLSWPERDLAAAEALIAQVHNDLEYLSAARERAEAARAAATAVTDRALNEYRNRLSLVQTSVLGSLLTALTVVQTLHYDLPLPKVARLPTILVLTAVALFLPLAVLRQAAVSAVRLPYHWIDSAAAGLLGSSTCWLALTVWRLHSGDAPLPPAVTTSACVAVGLAVTAAAHRAARRR